MTPLLYLNLKYAQHSMVYVLFIAGPFIPKLHNTENKKKLLKEV